MTAKNQQEVISTQSYMQNLGKVGGNLWYHPSSLLWQPSNQDNVIIWVYMVNLEIVTSCRDEWKVKCTSSRPPISVRYYDSFSVVPIFPFFFFFK